MKKYQALIDQTFEFPNEEFKVDNSALYFHRIRLKDVIKEYGAH